MIWVLAVLYRFRQILFNYPYLQYKNGYYMALTNDEKESLRLKMGDFLKADPTTTDYLEARNDLKSQLQSIRPGFTPEAIETAIRESEPNMRTVLNGKTLELQNRIEHMMEYLDRRL